MAVKTAVSISADEPLPPHLREFDDVDRTRTLIYDNALDSLKTRFPMSDGGVRLELHDVRYDGPQHFSMAQQKRALITGRSLKTPVAGTWKLVDEADGKVLDERKDTVMHIPYYTARGTFINGGNDYSVISQSRLKPGVYARTRASGEHEAHFNVRPGTGPGFRIWMEPETGIFRVNIGQSNVPVYPLFKTLGVEDDAMRKLWGDEIYHTNVNKTDSRALDKLYQRFAGTKHDPQATSEQKEAFLRDSVPRAELDEWVTGKTMGMPSKNVTPELMLRATHKLLNISRGEEEGSDRDDPKFSNVLSVEDFVKERIDKDAGRTAARLMWKVKRDRSLRRVPRGALNPYITTLMQGSGLTEPLAETNTMNLLDQLHRITKLGEGGIPSAESVTDEARDVNPGQTGFIDLIAGPECYDAETEMLTGRGWVHVDEVQENDAVATVEDGQTVYQLPEKVHRYEYRGMMFHCENTVNFCVTPEHDMVLADLDKIMVKRRISQVARIGFPVLCGRGDEPGMRVERVSAEHVKTIKYSGTVYCVTVPGGVVCVRRRGGLPFWCGNSEKIGVDVRAAYRTYKGTDRQLHAEFTDARTGKKVFLRPEDMDGKTLAFPAQDPGDDKVTALRNGKFVHVDPDEVDYRIPSLSHMFGPTVNLQTMPTAIGPSRTFYAAKYWSQFMPMVKGEAPFVQTLVPDHPDMTFHEYYGRKTGMLHAPADGVVTRVSGDNISMVTEDGKKHVVELPDNFPLNRLTSMSFSPVVKAGDVVRKGDSVAHSNFVDKDTGALNMGVNLKTAIIPYLGKSYEDAFVISASAAKKLANERLVGIDKDRRNGVEVSRNRYISAFPNKYAKDKLDNIDSDGIVKPGSVVHKGDPVILATGPRLLSSEDAELGNLHKLLRNTFRDESLTWDYNEPGVVTDVALTASGARVNIKSQSSVQQGDKLTSASASKGVTAVIVDDDDMPRDAITKEPYEMLLNPMVVQSRMAPNQLMELPLGKIARKTGRGYRLPAEAPEEGWNTFTENELKKHGVAPKADLYDPLSGRTIKDVNDGYMYISAFHHLAEKKLCLTTDTEVETAGGWKPILEVTPEDRLVTLNRETMKRELEHPQRILVYDVRGEKLVRVETDRQDLVGTKDHDFYFEERGLKFTGGLLLSLG